MGKFEVSMCRDMDIIYVDGIGYGSFEVMHIDGLINSETLCLFKLKYGDIAGMKASMAYRFIDD